MEFYIKFEVDVKCEVKVEGRIKIEFCSSIFLVRLRIIEFIGRFLSIWKIDNERGGLFLRFWIVLCMWMIVVVRRI